MYIPTSHNNLFFPSIRPLSLCISTISYFILSHQFWHCSFSRGCYFSEYYFIPSQQFLLRFRNSFFFHCCFIFPSKNWWVNEATMKKKHYQFHQLLPPSCQILLCSSPPILTSFFQTSTYLFLNISYYFFLNKKELLLNMTRKCQYHGETQKLVLVRHG